jgi:F0F1-type ATP synthase membrane subunit a
VSLIEFLAMTAALVVVVFLAFREALAAFVAVVHYADARDRGAAPAKARRVADAAVEAFRDNFDRALGSPEAPKWAALAFGAAGLAVLGGM